MHNSGKPSLTPNVLEVVLDLAGVKLTSIFKNHCLRNVKSGDDILLNEFSHLDYSNGSYGLGL